MGCHLRSKIAILSLFLLCSIFLAPALSAEPPEIWGNLVPGPHGIGFKTIEKYDLARSFGSKYDYFGNLREGERARPIQVGVWYPAQATPDDISMTFAEYAFPYPQDSRFMDFLAAVQNRSNQVFAGFFMGDQGMLLDLMSLDVGAVKDAAPAEGSFPLIIYCPDEQAGIANGFILCEYLASHGFIVAATPSIGTADIQTGRNAADLESMIRDKEVALELLHNFPGVDQNRLGTVGVGFGGLASLLLQMRNSAFDAVAALDGAFIFADFHDMTRNNPYFDNMAMTAPFLQMYSETFMPTDLSIVDSLMFCNRYSIHCHSLEHPDFSSWGSISALRPDTAGPAPEVRRYRHEVICDYILNFLKAKFEDDQEALAYLTNDATANGLDPDFLTVTMTEAKILPPSAQQFATIIQQCGPDTLRDLNETFGLFKPEAPLLNAGTVNGLGYQSLQSGDAQKALVIFGFNTQSNPGSANAWDSYGEACLGVGDNAEALRAYRKALELIPTDSTLTDQFRDLIMRGATATIERLEAEADGGAGTE